MRVIGLTGCTQVVFVGFDAEAEGLFNQTLVKFYQVPAALG
jgi:hypothetical protein